MRKKACSVKENLETKKVTEREELDKTLSYQMHLYCFAPALVTFPWGILTGGSASLLIFVLKECRFSLAIVWMTVEFEKRGNNIKHKSKRAQKWEKE